ncbi:phage/conjugal plasmid C-4 type zinc finger protein, TraR family [Syntrophus gentianae]|uniref:Phage/conjugal plasmid C-4 type zinc finger protein, TraR family n=1 Tax=Syntrophus gentianae TaxID=43775 RepID=A0A1H8B9B1_9BACT|nr:TraR/DksA C4-type zinc finger protein [Syntrophus gentianae]SEM78989.1 phage/conjugal plasmid C-4 type zinc finger protein, TraR family [Syntrophus gentianae]
MPDEIDQAQHHDELFREQALSSHYNRVRKKAGLHRSLAGGTGCSECIDCGEPIEPARLAVMPNAIRCLDCQSRHERLYGRNS